MALTIEVVIIILKARDDEDQAESQQPAGTEDETEDLLLDDDGKLTRPLKARYVPFKERLEKENQIYYIPSVNGVDFSQKTEDTKAEPRLLEDEGFYVGDQPAVTTRNIRFIEERISKQANKGTKWFDQGGRLKYLADPLKQKVTRPVIALFKDDEESSLKLDYHLLTLLQPIVTSQDSYVKSNAKESQDYQLDINLSSLTFTHHPLMSHEHVFHFRILRQYYEYCQRKKGNTANYYTGKLQALKEAIFNLQHVIKSHHSEDIIAIQATDRLKDYKFEVSNVRRMRDSEDYKDRSLIKSMITTWNELKQLREKQGYANTSTKLIMHKKIVDKKEDAVKWDKEIKDELEEAREFFDEEYQEKLANYKKELKEWKRKNKGKKRRKKRKQRQQQDEENPAEDEVVGTDLFKPVPPDNFNEQQALIEIKENAIKCRRRPGEAILFPELVNTVPISPTSKCPKAEAQRRREVQEWHAYIRILFNDNEVHRSATKALTGDFNIHFGEICKAKIIQWPENIKLELYEAGIISSRLIAQVFIPPPNSMSHAGLNPEPEAFQFSSDLKISYNHTGVGAGVSVTATGSEHPMTLLMSGDIYSNVVWSVDENGCPMMPAIPSVSKEKQAMQRVDAVAAIGARGIIDIQKLMDWIVQSRLDPNDPANDSLLDILRACGVSPDGKVYLPDYFRLNSLSHESDLGTEEDIDKSKRFKILKLRSQEASEFRNLKQVPIRDIDIPDDILRDYYKRLEEDEKVDLTALSHRERVNRFLSKVREEVLQRSRIAQRQYQLSDVVREDFLPDIGTLGASVGQLLKPRRPLRPVRKERKKIAAQHLGMMNVKILVNVVRAFDIPIRKNHPRYTEDMLYVNEIMTISDDQTQSTMRHDNTTDIRGIRNLDAEELQTEVQVRPFVEVMFQRNIRRTEVADGPNPAWNQQIVMPFRAPHDDYSSNNLMTVNDDIYFNLFDEEVIDMLSDDRERGTNIHRRKERHWLGSIRIPFSTLYTNSRIEGSFRINSPTVLLGYSHAKSAQVESGQALLDVGKGSRSQTYLSMFVTIEPPLAPPPSIKEKVSLFDSKEDIKLLKYSQTWLNEFESKFSNREINILVTDINGMSVFVTRYITPQNPPVEVYQEGVEPTLENSETVARFVSLIPFISDSVSFAGLCDIWSTSSQFLQMLAGDEEEHAVLLCNYFLYMGKKAWIALGMGIPEGSTAYVVSEEANGDFMFWNASTGDHFRQHDAHCPLQSIGCLIGRDNVYANIQSNDIPSRMSMDTTNTKLWKPFFNSSFPYPGLSSVQEETLVYHATDSNYVGELEERIELVLKESIMSWRRRFVTRWNRYDYKLRLYFELLEESRRNASEERHLNELSHILDSYKLSGFPIHMPYTDIEPVIDAVYSTGVHTVESPDVEFALATHIHAYPNSVLSLWIYVGTVTKISSA
ncbi:uncharacterized protein TRIADDRAFT_28071 [Trichoplax adhaerens]|uniref:C2 domain-containing protein n=1 Tax=Trichoplax adhaerens TaxID=10228 RepID=B3S2C5_TRIAD|nr:hypothetical protein TRIADDRAFT_28071 [Trichoplax adhaerens]EDV23074.1 hypothetical protein TRIADDRAFT_28071 [Trichoplax adhaerens]|eukprot:XP_002113984.1 hypothetical protein TRIADDRAFT_28071 [Trichoplax adhaerens]